MGDLKFEYEGTTYNVPCIPNKYWREALLYYGDCPARLLDCQDSMCSCCIYHRGNRKAREAFYYECFPEEKPVEAEKCCKECANYKPKEEEHKKLPKLTQEVFGREDCPEWANYAAVDRDGKAYWHMEKTKAHRSYGIWIADSHPSTRIPGRFDSSDWEHSVIERPYFSSYKILTETNFVTLEHKVNELMKQGWVPRGGAVKDDYFYMQTMVKI